MGQLRITRICDYCGCEFSVILSEIKKQQKKGRTKFFCSLSCGAKFNNGPSKYSEIEKECAHCKKCFKTNNGRHEASFCSRSCASAGSVTNHRRVVAKKHGTISARAQGWGTIESIAAHLKSRERWKYSRLKAFLGEHRINYEFEFVVGHGIFDLALVDHRILVEFDSRYHMSGRQRKKDAIKTNHAQSVGWKVIRIKTGYAELIAPSSIVSIVDGIYFSGSGKAKNQ